MSEKEIPVALSFDDVLLLPQRSDVLPADIKLNTPLTKNISLHIPMLSSAMDTVSESKLAIALAREGGMGVIHRNCPIEEQVDMVSRVKRSENIVIEQPLTVQADLTIAALKELMRKTGISGFPVVDPAQTLQGIVTRRDIWILEDENQKIDHVMTPRPKVITAPAGCNQEEARSILYTHRIEKLPLVDTDDRLVGLMTRADIEKRLMFQDASKDHNGHLRVGAAIGTDNDSLERAHALTATGCDALFIDAATGHTDRVIKNLQALHSEYPEIPVIAGNVVTPEGANDLIKAGAAAIKVGVGPGSICTTRMVAGVGVPQFSAIKNVATICHEKDIPLIADGGIRYSGDIIKALAAGASCIMVGSLFAGTEESPGRTIRWQGRTFKEYRGMGSISAMRKGSSDRYGQNASGKLVPEGVEARVPYKGKMSDLLFQLMGGVRSGMGYIGAENIKALKTKARFIRITSGGLTESHPHDITLTEEPINYSV
ncbi:MAG: IMP dehydrogenase [Kiritimatiellae bacterium]|nr:IMP dehydrogenase [Kiritimatiellia bacterium]